MVITEVSETSKDVPNLYSGNVEKNGNGWIGRPLLLGSYYVEEISRSEGYELSRTGKNLSESNRTGKPVVLAESGSAHTEGFFHRINEWEGNSYDFTVNYFNTNSRGRIDEAVGSDDPDIRYLAANELLLKIWKYVKKAIQRARADLGKDFMKLPPHEQEKKAREYLNENLKLSSLSGGYGGLCRRFKTIEGWDGSLDSGKETGQEGSGQEKEEQEKENGQTEKEGKDGPGEGGQNEGREEEQSQSGKGRGSNTGKECGSQENSFQENASNENHSEAEDNDSQENQGETDKEKEGKDESGDNGENDEKDNDENDGSRAPSHIILLRLGQLAVQGQDDDRNEEQGGEAGLPGRGGGIRTGEISRDLLELLNKAAEEAYGKQEEIKLKKHLEDEAEELSPEGIHKGVPIRVYRELEITPDMEAGYKTIESEIKKAASRLRQTVEEILIRKEGGVMSGLYMGKRLSRGNLYRQDGKIFEKRILPEEGFSVAFGVLVDNSGSMTTEDRIGQARKAALVLYEFCRSLSIPITVYGHSTCSVFFNGSYQEGVAMYSFAEFDSVDGKDHLRIQRMGSSQCNRDGLALRFVGKHLAKREEEVKILTLISDGSPYAVNYGGETAKADLRMAKQELHKMGVTLLSAAIGDDREVIEDIYGDSFLNISDLKTMPQKLAALLLRYIR